MAFDSNLKNTGAKEWKPKQRYGQRKPQGWGEWNCSHLFTQRQQFVEECVRFSYNAWACFQVVSWSQMTSQTCFPTCKLWNVGDTMFSLVGGTWNTDKILNIWKSTGCQFTSRQERKKKYWLFSTWAYPRGKGAPFPPVIMGGIGPIYVRRTH